MPGSTLREPEARAATLLANGSNSSAPKKNGGNDVALDPNAETDRHAGGHRRSVKGRRFARSSA
jgi:hypothetical protein